MILKSLIIPLILFLYRNPQASSSQTTTRNEGKLRDWDYLILLMSSADITFNSGLSLAYLSGY